MWPKVYAMSIGCFELNQLEQPNVRATGSKYSRREEFSSGRTDRRDGAELVTRSEESY
jgi:hypothetical protein